MEGTTKKITSIYKSKKRQLNRLRYGLADLDNLFDFSLPTHSIGLNLNKNENENFVRDETGCESDCSWFGFMLRVKENNYFTRTDLARYLDKHRIGNRMLFGESY